MDLLQEIPHLVHLNVTWLKNLWTRSEVIYNRNGQNFKTNQLLNFALRSLVVESFGKVVNSVFVFVGEFPPVRAHLADALDVVLF